MSPRLSLAVENGLLPADASSIVVFGARQNDDLSALPKEAVQIVQGMKPDHDAWKEHGYAVSPDIPGEADIAIVLLPRAKALARDWIARAMAISREAVILDGQKEDGIDSLLRELRAWGAVEDVLAKAHGKIARLSPGIALPNWRDPGPRRVAGSFYTSAGVFSADKIDRGSAMLASALPSLAGRVVDLGAGWGYLSHHILLQPGVTALDLVEADHAALACARRNISDVRATFHWADAHRWTPEDAADAVVSNPPFHSGRKADLDLGRGFVRDAARMLSPRGAFHMVANRHLPYEAVLVEQFNEVAEIAGDPSFKVFTARRPRR
ncbi:class I SAM-dependent methyltransferase [Aestuariibius sp. 2305UL40-4]|uniref:class I SAM-dependent methyltransferase n=1 Tax=Aestuariibius violaceus TaxID=3234132 RepID=UPI00345EBD0B